MNFGVFALYNDKALVTSVNITLQLALSVPLNELVVRGEWVERFIFCVRFMHWIACSVLLETCAMFLTFNP